MEASIDGVDQAEFTVLSLELSHFWDTQYVLYFTRAIEKLLFFTMMVKLRMISFQRLEKNLSFISVKLIKCPPLSHTLPYHSVVQTKFVHQRNSFLWNTMTVSRFASPLAFPEDGKREWVYEGAEAETQGPSPDIENTSTSFGRTNVSRCSGISFASGPPWKRGK